MTPGATLPVYKLPEWKLIALVRLTPKQLDDVRRQRYVHAERAELNVPPCVQTGMHAMGAGYDRVQRFHGNLTYFPMKVGIGQASGKIEQLVTHRTADVDAFHVVWPRARKQRRKRQ